MLANIECWATLYEIMCPCMNLCMHWSSVHAHSQHALQEQVVTDHFAQDISAPTQPLPSPYYN